MLRDDSFHLRHMLEATQVSQLFAQDRIRADLDNDLIFFYALVKVVEIIGEAASHVTRVFQASRPKIEWEVIIGMRNRLVHTYYDINRDVVWEAVQDGVPILISQLEVVLGQSAR